MQKIKNIFILQSQIIEVATEAVAFLLYISKMQIFIMTSDRKRAFFAKRKGTTPLIARVPSLKNKIIVAPPPQRTAHISTPEAPISLRATIAVIHYKALLWQLDFFTLKAPAHQFLQHGEKFDCSYVAKRKKIVFCIFKFIARSQTVFS